MFDRIVRHLKLMFAAEKPPPARVFEEVALIAAEESEDYELRVVPRGLSRFGRLPAVLPIIRPPEFRLSKS